VTAACLLTVFYPQSAPMGSPHSDVLRGQSYPLGATVCPGGVNFCVFSKNATAIDLLLFDDIHSPEPSRIIQFDPQANKTFYYWHGFVPDIGMGQIYAYRVYGPYNPDKGLRFNSNKVLLDPYARAVVGWRRYDRAAAIHAEDNCAQALRGVVLDPNNYDWEGDMPLQIPYAKTIIYEMHVGGFTRHPNSGVTPEKRGTYAGVIEKIPYLKELGITAVELLPIHEFDEQDVRPGLKNYWGYSTVSFFAPHRAYSSRLDPLGHVDEFRDMVKALHRAGIEVILDVVFNHSAEGDHRGPTLSFKGFENQAYYILDAKRPEYYANYSGCGNTLKANHEIVGQMIIDSLRYWVASMHVDGFRFDLASVLSRSRTGHPLEDPPILWSIESDPILAGTKIIAEAWDAGGLYQVGSFIGERFAEWNGPFRDDVRRFVKSDSNTVSRVAARILGSPDIYQQPDREITRSINFVTCHDGFTLNDLVSYNDKHNEANNENNCDGSNDNQSWNCGVEGKTDDPEVNALRQRQIKNLLTILFMSQGTPMLLMGDEVRRTQHGNNNAYCQDSEISWFDWDAIDRHAGLLRFVRRLIRFSQSLDILQQTRLLEVTERSDNPHLTWHGLTLHQPDWSENSHVLACTLCHPEASECIHLMMNAYWMPLTFELPSLQRGESWYRLIDTALPSPNDIYELQDAPVIRQRQHTVEPRSTVILMSQIK